MAGVRKRPRPRKVQVTGHKHVVGSLRAARITARRAGATSGAEGDSGGGGGGSASSDLARRLREAAQVIGDQARVNAAWSRRVPASIKISGSATISISSSSPPAYPNEIAGVRHPVFGGRGTSRPHAPWVTNQHRPFLAPAADEKADEAAAKVAEVIDDWAKERGFK